LFRVEAASDDGSQNDAGAVPSALGITILIPTGRSELCETKIDLSEEDRTGQKRACGTDESRTKSVGDLVIAIAKWPNGKLERTFTIATTKAGDLSTGVLVLSVKGALNSRKQRVQSERFEQVRASTGVLIVALRRISCHFNDRYTNFFSNYGDISASAIRENVVDQRHIDVGRSQNRISLLHGPCGAYTIRVLQRRLDDIQH